MTALLLEARLPECWIPPPDILEARTLSRLRKALVDERREWMQRIHAQLYHQGVSGTSANQAISLANAEDGSAADRRRRLFGGVVRLSHEGLSSTPRSPRQTLEG